MALLFSLAVPTAFAFHAHQVGRTSHTVAIAPRATPPPSMLVETDKHNWCEDVEGCGQLTVVFFYAPWCRNCKAVRPRLERLEREYAGRATFLQCNFKAEPALCYEQRVFSFPTVHFYLPRIGRVSRAVLTGKDAVPKVRERLGRFLGGSRQLRLLQSLTAEAVRPVVQYKALVEALEALAAMAHEPKEADATAFGQGVPPKKESARLRGLVQGDELRLAGLEAIFAQLDADADGRLRLADLERVVAAVRAGDGDAAAGEAPLLERLRGVPGLDGPVGVDQATFVSLMVDKAVQDFAQGDRALMPVFEALDADGDGTVAQAQLLSTIERFCAALPEAEGCEVDHRPLRLAQAFNAFANDAKLLDYQRFVEMVSGREGGGEECEVGAPRRAAASTYLEEEAERSGERECFGEGVDDQGEDDPSCDAWFFGEDPTEEKMQRTASPEKAPCLAHSDPLAALTSVC